MRVLERIARWSPWRALAVYYPREDLSWRHQPGRKAGTVASEDVDFSDPN